MTDGLLARPVRAGAPVGRRGFFGVSVGASAPRLARDITGLQWVLDHFAEPACLIGDSLYRITLQTHTGIGSQQAAQQAIDAGARHLREFQAAGVRLPTVFRSSDIATWQGFQQAHHALRALYAGSPAFRTSVDRDAQAYCTRQARSGRLAIAMEQALGLSVGYLLEEIAVYHALSEAGWPIEAHVGPDLPTLLAFVAGAFGDTMPALRHRTYIELKVTRRKAAA